MSQLTLFSETVEIKALPYQYASEAVENFAPGCRILGFTKGQFSLVDLALAVLKKTGPANVTISTWSAGLRDAKVMEGLLNTSEILSFTMLVDRSFPSRHPKIADSIQRLFGAESIRTSNTHAKFVMIQNETFNVVIKTSMNLNHNPRFENFDLDDNTTIYAFFKNHVDELFDLMPKGFVESRSVVNPAFDKCMKDDVTKSGVTDFMVPAKSFSRGANTFR